MTSRGTILIGLLLCAALLAGTRLTSAPSASGECAAVELETNENGYKSGFQVFRGSENRPLTWHARDGELVIGDGRGKSMVFPTMMIGNFKCILPAPR